MSVLRCEVRDRKAYVTINRPEVMNAMNTEVKQGLADAFTRADEDDEVYLVILRGEGGRAFSSGADLKETAARTDAGRGSPGPRSARVRPYRPGAMLGFDEVDRCGKPVIAAIDGYCIAGGLELALYCDIRIATRKSVFSLPEPRRNMLSGPALIQLSRMIPLGEALLLELTGEPMSAERAYQIGLIQGVADDRDALDQAVERTADAIIQNSPLAVQFIKRVVRGGRDMTVEQQWRFSEMFAHQLHGSEDFAEGLRAFAEKRKPQWKMR